MKYIEFKNGKWRFKNRRANIFDAIDGMLDRNDSMETLSKQIDVPIDAIIEAIDFIDKNPKLKIEHLERMFFLINNK